jgi:hypothetical protein
MLCAALGPGCFPCGCASRTVRMDCIQIIEAFEDYLVDAYEGKYILFVYLSFHLLTFISLLFYWISRFSWESNVGGF